VLIIKEQVIDTLLAIDPGNEKSAYCFINKETYQPIEFGILPNKELRELILDYPTEIDMAIEMVASYGMAVGSTIFETCLWIGRFIECYKRNNVKEPKKVYRKDVKLHICNSPRAKDSNIRQALIDRFGEVGTKAEKGFFYGFKSDIWSAYAVGVFYLDK
jgi:hypothetical protein